MDAKTLRTQTIRDAKCNLILDSARKIFANNGFHGAKLDDIAQTAGFSKASLYNYFSDKEELFLSLAVRDFEELLAKLRNGMKASEPLLASIEYLFRTLFTFFGEQFAFFSTASDFSASFDCQHLQKHHQELLATFQGNYGLLLDTFREILQAARARGEIATSVDETTIARFVSALARGTIFEWKLSHKMGDVEQTIKDLLEFITHGIGRPVVSTAR